MPTLIPYPEPDGYETLNQSFDFSKLPNLKEVNLAVYRFAGDLLWIYAALLTIKPATSPHLSTIQLKISGRLLLERIPERSREELIHDLRLIDEEVDRIEREFSGSVNLIVHRYPGYEVCYPSLILTYCSRILKR
jgi:hypothetical protein